MTSKSATSDSSVDSFQNAIAAAGMASEAQAGKAIDRGVVKAGGSEGTKSSASDAKKKSASSEEGEKRDEAVAQLVPGLVTVPIVAVQVPQTVATEQGGSANPKGAVSVSFDAMAAVAGRGNGEQDAITTQAGDDVPGIVDGSGVVGSAKGASVSSLQPDAVTPEIEGVQAKVAAKIALRTGDQSLQTLPSLAKTSEKAGASSAPDTTLQAKTTTDAAMNFTLPQMGTSVTVSQPQAAGTSDVVPATPMAGAKGTGKAKASPIDGLGQSAAAGKAKAGTERVPAAATEKQAATTTDDALRQAAPTPETVSKVGGSNDANFSQTMAQMPVPQAGNASDVGATANLSAAAAKSPEIAVVHTAEQSQASQALNSAQLIQSVHGSEMRLGMQSAEFGSISINTSLNHQALSAQISIDHTALGHALAIHLPAIEEKLGSAYGVQAKVELRDTGAGASSQGSNGESRGSNQARGNNGGSFAASGVMSRVAELSAASMTTSTAANSSRLDIRI